MTSSQWIPAGLRAEVRRRARGRCEYCGVHEEDVLAPHEPDHIVAEQHGGRPIAENLAYACFHGNRHKGAKLASIDPKSGQPVFLFQPRKENWADHFPVEGTLIAGLTAAGRTTSALLKFNASERLESRRLLVLARRYPG